MRNPLNNSNGKSDTARNCYTKKFRKGWDEIDWNDVDKAFRSKKKVKPLTPSKFNELVNKLRKK